MIAYHYAYQDMADDSRAIGVDSSWDTVKMVLGTVPVHEDGSAMFRVPANTPLTVQPLDAQGKAVQLMRSWMTAMPGETLSCVGCHAPSSAVPSGPIYVGGTTRTLNDQVLVWASSRLQLPTRSPAGAGQVLCRLPQRNIPESAAGLFPERLGELRTKIA